MFRHALRALHALRDVGTNTDEGISKRHGVPMHDGLDAMMPFSLSEQFRLMACVHDESRWIMMHFPAHLTPLKAVEAPAEAERCSETSQRQ
jgi:hypothetical protein